MTSIRFGTAGWRALIARDFTFANVRLASQGVADYLKAGLADPASLDHLRSLLAANPTLLPVSP